MSPSKRPSGSGTIAMRAAGTLLRYASARVYFPCRMTSSGSTPRLSVALHCGSVSITHTLYPSAANAPAVATVLLVFPHPPF